MESKNTIEMMGIKKTKEEVLGADLILFLGESSSDLDLINDFEFDKGPTIFS